MAGQAKIGIIMGSLSDWPTMKRAADVLDELGVAYEAKVVSAHRTPKRLYEYAETAKARGLKVIIAGAGGAAHLPGMTAAMTTLPVLGVPIASKALSGQDSLLSIVQMPAGVPVGTLAIGEAGATNAGLLAAQILALERRRRLPSGSRRCAPGRRRPFPRRRRTMPEGRLRAAAAARLHHRHPGQRPARPHAGAWRPRASASRRTSIARKRPGLRRGDAHQQGRLRRRGGACRLCARASMRSPTSSRTWRSRRPSFSTASCRCGRAPGRCEVAQDRLAEKEFIAALGIPVAPFAAVDGPAESRTPRSPPSAAASHPEDAPARLRRQGPGERWRRGDDAAAAGQPIGARPAVLERRIAVCLGASVLVVRSAGRRAGLLRLSRATRTRTASCAAPWCRRACRPPTSRAPARSPPPSPTRSTMSACWPSRCSTSAPTRRPPSG